MIDTGSQLIWAMWPSHGNGIGAAFFHPTEAYFIQKRGWLKVDGKKAIPEEEVETAEAIEGKHSDLAGYKLLRLRFVDEWTAAHP